MRREVISSFLLLMSNACLCAVTPDFIASLVNNFTAYAPRTTTEEPPAERKLWAFLVAGSKDWHNYRHQADLCHAYQTLHGHGIPDEQIVVMMYDDIAQNEQNPTPGIIINHPNGEDVYNGVPGDYRGMFVDPDNFLSALQGQEDKLVGIGSGKSIKSGPNDHVFLYFVDHGGAGVLGFPDEELSADALNSAIQSMFDNKQFAKMVIYIEACFSGSIFDGLLPDNINVYATTAANSNESSYSCYYDEERGTYLGDTYSVLWMEDSDEEVLTEETLKSQFQLVKKETITSHVSQFGEMSITDMHVSEFQGNSTSPNGFVPPKVPLNPVKSDDVPLAILLNKLDQYQNDPVKSAQLEKEIRKLTRNRAFLNTKMLGIVLEATGGVNNQLAIVHQHRRITDFNCYNRARKYFNQECFNIAKNTYSFSVLYILVNLCEEGISASTLERAMDEVCTHPPVYGII